MNRFGDWIKYGIGKFVLGGMAVAGVAAAAVVIVVNTTANKTDYSSQLADKETKTETVQIESTDVPVADVAKTEDDKEEVKEEVKEEEKTVSEDEELDAEDIGPKGLTGTYLRKFTDIEDWDLNIYDYCPGFSNGDTVRITVVYDGDGGYACGVGSCNGPDYAWEQGKLEQPDGGRGICSITVAAYSEVFKAQIWWIGGTEVGVASIKVDLISKNSSGASAGGGNSGGYAPSGFGGATIEFPAEAEWIKDKTRTPDGKNEMIQFNPGAVAGKKYRVTVYGKGYSDWCAGIGTNRPDESSETGMAWDQVRMDMSNSKVVVEYVALYDGHTVQAEAWWNSMQIYGIVEELDDDAELDVPSAPEAGDVSSPVTATSDSAEGEGHRERQIGVPGGAKDGKTYIAHIHAESATEGWNAGFGACNKDESAKDGFSWKNGSANLDAGNADADFEFTAPWDGATLQVASYWGVVNFTVTFEEKAAETPADPVNPADPANPAVNEVLVPSTEAKEVALEGTVRGKTYIVHIDAEGAVDGWNGSFGYCNVDYDHWVIPDPQKVETGNTHFDMELVAPQDNANIKFESWWGDIKYTFTFEEKIAASAPIVVNVDSSDESLKSVEIELAGTENGKTYIVHIDASSDTEGWNGSFGYCNIDYDHWVIPDPQKVETGNSHFDMELVAPQNNAKIKFESWWGAIKYTVTFEEKAIPAAANVNPTETATAPETEEEESEEADEAEEADEDEAVEETIVVVLEDSAEETGAEEE